MKHLRTFLRQSFLVFTAMTGGATIARAGVATDFEVGHWTLNDNANSSVVVDSIGGLDGIVNNTLNDFSSELHVPGHVGSGAFDFSRVGTYVSVPDSAALFIADHMSVSFWAYINPNGPHMTGQIVALVKKTSGSIASGGWQVVWDDRGAGVADGRFKAITFNTMDGSSLSAANTNFIITTSGWYHIVGTYDTAVGSKLFINGTLAASGSPISTILDNDLPLSIGPIDDGKTLDGKLDDVRLYRKVLTAGEIDALYNSGFGTEAEDQLTLDFDGDHAADLGVFHTSTGNWYVRQSSNGATFSGGAVTWGAGANPVPADYDGDALADFAVYVPSAATWHIRMSTTDQYLDGWPIAWGPVGAIPVPLDYDGDRRYDLAVYTKADGKWFIRKSTDHTMMSGAPIVWGPNADSVPADYDGDGIADLAVYAKVDGKWYIRQSSTGAMTPGGPLSWGPGAIPVPADYDGDLRADLAVYAVDGKWYIRSSKTGTTLSGSPFDWGHAKAYPVPNDYDGDLIADLGVYAPANGKWYIRQSHDGSMLGGGSGVSGGILWGRPGVRDLTPIFAPYQTLRLLGRVP